MVDQISVNMFNTVPAAFNFEAKTRSKPEHEQVELPEKTDKKNLILPLSLMAGGGILLYYGITSPTKAKIVRNIVKDHKAQIEQNVEVFTRSVDDTLKNAYGRIEGYIEKYVSENTMDIPDNLTRSEDPKNVVKVVDFLFEALKDASPDKARFGVSSDIGRFSSEMDDIKRGVDSELGRKRECLRLLFDDFSKLPQSEDKEIVKLIGAASAELPEVSSSALDQMDVNKFIKHKKVISNYYKQMAQAITNIRESRLNTKQSLINSAYENLSKIFGLGDDFEPAYSKVPTLDRFNSLTLDQLKPVKKVPSELEGIYEGNVYFDAAVSKDFSKINQDDLNRIFYSADYDNNLKDLGFLIDRLRLRQKVCECKNMDSGFYSNVIAKLEYLANKLNGFSQDELIKKCPETFTKMNAEKRRASLYYLSRISMRMGFSTFEQMDKFMASNPEYKNLKIRNSIETIKSKPELYFF